MKKNISRVLLGILLVASLSSCSSEYRTLSRMEKLTDRIETNGYRYTMQDWKDAVEDYRAIEKQAKKCSFTQDERERMGEMEGRAMACFAKWTADKAAGIYKQGKGILNGLLEGLGLGPED